MCSNLHGRWIAAASVVDCHYSERVCSIRLQADNTHTQRVAMPNVDCGSFPCCMHRWKRLGYITNRELLNEISLYHRAPIRPGTSPFESDRVHRHLTGQ